MPSYHAKLTADLDANTSGFKRGMREAQRSLKNIDRSLSRFGKTLGALFGAGAVTGLAKWSKSALEAADNIAKTADKIGITTESLQELRFAAEQVAGVTERQLDVAMQRFSRRVGEAAQGQGDLKKILDQYGISVRDVDGNMRDLDAILGEYADRVQGAESSQEQLRLAFKAFDSEGAQMVNLLRGGSAALIEWRRNARDAAVVMRDDLVRSGETLNSEWDKAIRQMDTTFRTFALNVFQWFQDFENLPLSAQMRQVKGEIDEVTATMIAAQEEVALIAEEVDQSGLGGFGTEGAGLRSTGLQAVIARGSERLRELNAQYAELEKRKTKINAKFSEFPPIANDSAKGVKKMADEWDRLLDIYSEEDDELRWDRWVERATGANMTTAAVKTLKTAVEETKESANTLDFAFQSAFESAIFNGEKLGDVLKSLAKDIATVFIRQSITAPLASAAGGFLSSIFGGFFASGGVAPANKISVVGENGPEFLMPARDTAVVPAGMGGVTVTNQWDFSGANPATVQLLRQEASRIVEASKAGVLAAIEQGGGYARSVGRRT